MKVVVADNFEAGALKLLEATGAQIVHKPESLEAELADAKMLVVRSATRVTEELLSIAPNLKVVARAGVGLDNVDQDACKKRGIEVMNTPSASTNAVAEFALALILGASRNVPRAHHSMKQGKWEKKVLAGSEVEGRTLGIIGCGRIGSLLAEKARALGMEVLGYNPPPRHDSPHIKYVELDELFGSSDIISLHVPSTPETNGMINKGTISKMKDGAILINTARGSIVEEDALYGACKSGKIRAAALDVFPSEPYSGKLLELENVFCTPHIAASTAQAQERIGELIAQKISSLMSCGE
ncbi:hydroxyacid dehydrogenase [Candidatus Micrarchaeota archaeon]|nr:hydroxyacid dehydrogenase [Candidatus Micrarchaeota archaeon]